MAGSFVNLKMLNDALDIGTLSLKAFRQPSLLRVPIERG